MHLAAVTLLLCVPTFINGLDNGLGKTPPMGWSTWNFFQTDINETIVHTIADLMVSKGMLEAGYEYVNIDAGWAGPGRDSSGRLYPVATKFPHGMKAVGDYIHSKGLKFGLYTDIGHGSCGPNGPGSAGNYVIDANTFATWGVDYLKVDACGHFPCGELPCTSSHHNELYRWQQLRDALNQTHRKIYYSICPKTIAPNSGTAAPYAGRRIYSPPTNWTVDEHRTLSNSWLVEYVNNYDVWYTDVTRNGRKGIPFGFLTNLDSVTQMTKPGYDAPGGWNDADMLQVCNYGKGGDRMHSLGMTTTEYRSAFTLWVILSSPLIHSLDLRNIVSQDCFDMIKNKNVIAVNQDPLGMGGKLVKSTGGTTTPTISTQVYMKRLVSNRAAVVLFNRNNVTETIGFSWEEIGYPSGTLLALVDLWQNKTVGIFHTMYSAEIAAHDVLLLSISP